MLGSLSTNHWVPITRSLIHPLIGSRSSSYRTPANSLPNGFSPACTTPNKKEGFEVASSLVGSHCLASIAYRTVGRTEGHSPEHCVIGDPAKRPSLVKTSKPTATITGSWNDIVP